MFRSALRPAFCLSVLLFCAVLQPGSAHAEVALDNESRILIFGDVRLRYENDSDSVRPDGTEREDRDRGRFRARLGFRWQPVERFGVTVRARSGNTDNQQSPHVTFMQSGSNGDGDILVDRAFMKLSFEQGWAWAGRHGNPFWHQTEYLFDDDVWFDGLGLGLRWGDADSKHEVNAFIGAPPEGAASLHLDEEGLLFGAQYVWHRGLGNGDMTLALGGVHVADDEDVANPVLLDQDYMIWTLSAQRVWETSRLPFTLGGDLFFNSYEPDETVWNHDETFGGLLFVRYGKLKEAHDWVVGYQYAHMETYSVVPYLMQDDWHRWGSATQTRSTNAAGHELRLGYAFRKDLNVLARLFLVDGIELQTPTATDKEENLRFRVDFNWKF